MSFVSFIKRHSVSAVLFFFIIAFSVIYPSLKYISKRNDNSNVVMEKTYYEYFDTVTKISSYSFESEQDFEENCSALDTILREYNIMLDIYHEYEWGNNLCTVNKMAGIEPVKVDPRIIEFLEFGRYICSFTGGKTDISMGSVLSLWHDCRVENRNSIPGYEELEKASEHIGFDSIIIDKENSTVFITDKYESIDAGAIGKGYVAEKAAQYLSGRGITSYVINIGGNVRMIGKKYGTEDWITGIREPVQSSQNLALRLYLSDTSCVTSGGYERFFTAGGKKYSHIIDKDTLYPPSYFSSVTVITKDSALADALSTALFCISYESGREFVQKMDNVQCIWIFNNGKTEYTDGVGAMLYEGKKNSRK